MGESVVDMIALIDRISEEHKTTFQRMQSLEQVANDVEAMAGMKKSKDTAKQVWGKELALGKNPHFLWWI